MKQSYFPSAHSAKKPSPTALLPLPNQSFFKKMVAFAGPGYLVAVGYMDPGNWATNLAGGSKFGYTLLSVILISNLMAIVLQYLSIKLGVITGKDLAQACRDYYSKPISIFLWILAEIGIIACDIAEVIGSAIGLQLLFGLPLFAGVVLTACDVFLFLALQHKRTHYLQGVIAFFIALIILCFLIIILLAKPPLAAILHGLIPHKEILYNSEMLYLAVGILGATVMPHNLYLHSALVKKYHAGSDDQKAQAVQFNSFDLVSALTIAFFVNAAILITSAAVFYSRGLYHVAEIQDAYQLLTPLLNSNLASTAFAVALLISGQNSTITGTLAGQIIMEGFINIQFKPWMRRLIGRALAIIPAALSILYFGHHGLAQLLLASQIILSLQLPFAIFPLIHFTSDSSKMSSFCNAKSTMLLSLLIAFIITGLNIWLISSSLLN